MRQSVIRAMRIQIAWRCVHCFVCEKERGRMASVAASESQPGVPERLPATNRRQRDIWEFSVAYCLILLALWTPRPWQTYLSIAALAWVLLVMWRSFEGWRAMGFRVAGFWRSAWVVAAA